MAWAKHVAYNLSCFQSIMSSFRTVGSKRVLCRHHESSIEDLKIGVGALLNASRQCQVESHAHHFKKKKTGLCWALLSFEEPTSNSQGAQQIVGQVTKKNVKFICPLLAHFCITSGVCCVPERRSTMLISCHAGKPKSVKVSLCPWCLLSNVSFPFVFEMAQVLNRIHASGQRDARHGRRYSPLL